MPGLKRRRITKKEVARSLGIARSTLYYDSKLQKKDWDLKIRIEEVLHVHPAYGHKRLALALQINKKRIRRVMRLFGIKPYRRRPKSPCKKREQITEIRRFNRASGKLALRGWLDVSQPFSGRNWHLGKGVSAARAFKITKN
jgi:hypothetical protein